MEVLFSCFSIYPKKLTKRSCGAEQDIANLLFGEGGFLKRWGLGREWGSLQIVWEDRGWRSKIEKEEEQKNEC